MIISADFLLWGTLPVRHFLLILLVVLPPFQALAASAKTLSHVAHSKLMHLLEHELGIAHHHDDEGNVHFDNADVSHQNLAELPSTSGSVMITISTFFPLPDALVAWGSSDISPLSVAGLVLEGPKRPPRPLA